MLKPLRRRVNLGLKRHHIPVYRDSRSVGHDNKVISIVIWRHANAAAPTLNSCEVWTVNCDQFDVQISWNMLHVRIVGDSCMWKMWVLVNIVFSYLIKKTLKQTFKPQWHNVFYIQLSSPNSRFLCP